MATKVVISGNYFPLGDLKYIENDGDLDIVTCPKLELITDGEIEVLRSQANDADLLIIALFGTDPDKLSRLGLEQIGAKKALWSFDSHHGYEKERLFQKYFDTYFVAHSLYMDKFDDVKIEWLPCCYIRFEMDTLRELRLRSLIEQERKYDIVFPFKPYSLGDRVELTGKLSDCFRRAGIRYHFGPVESGMAYTNMILKSRLVLNISLLDDLNIRNFEAWSLNRPMLTNKVPDHDKLTEVNYSMTYFFERNLSDFAQALNKALSCDDIEDTSVDVLNNHMLIHRYVEIINKSLGTNYHIEKVVANGSASVPQEPVLCELSRTNELTANKVSASGIWPEPECTSGYVFWQLGSGGGGRNVEIPWVLRRSKQFNGHSLLDVGCTGEHGKALMTYKYLLEPEKVRLTGIDLRRLEIVPPDNFEFINGDLMEYDFGTKFDFIMCISALEHVGLDVYGGKVHDRGDYLCLRRMAELLGDGGRLILTIPFGFSMVYEGWIRVYDEARLEDMLDFAGLKFVQTDFFRNTPEGYFFCTKEELREVKPYDKVTGDIGGLLCAELERTDCYG